MGAAVRGEIARSNRDRKDLRHIEDHQDQCAGPPVGALKTPFVPARPREGVRFA